MLAHSLSQIAVQSGVGLHLFDREPERAREALANIRTLSATGLDEVRGVLSFLRGDEPATSHRAAHPAAAARAARRRSPRSAPASGSRSTLDDRLAADLPPSAIQTTAYRIVQEALTNVVRHSGGIPATITLDASRRRRQLVVTDRPTTAAACRQMPTEGGGLRGMRERAELQGGTLAVDSRRACRHRVTARLPWEAPS